MLENSQLATARRVASKFADLGAADYQRLSDDELIAHLRTNRQQLSYALENMATHSREARDAAELLANL